MPKKVITRRQRKAAEAKRRYQQEKSTGETKPTEPEAVTGESSGAQHSPVVATNSGVRSEPAMVPSKTQAEEGAATATAETEMEMLARIIANDVNMMSDSKQKIKDTIKRPTSILGGLPPITSAGSQIEQVSFSKTITRRAAATINKIQKLSKAFNKKINPSIKHSSSATSQVAEPMNPSGQSPKEETNNKEADMKACPASDKNAPCDCQLCKMVLSQFLGRRKKSCKNSRRLANQRQFDAHLEACHSEASYEECTLQEPFGHEQRFLQLMELNQREIERTVRKRIKEFQKIKPNKKLKVNNRETETQPPPPPPSVPSRPPSKPPSKPPSRPPSKPPSKPIRPQIKPKSNIKETIATDKAKETEYTCSAHPDSLNLTIKANRKKSAEPISTTKKVQTTALSPPAEVAPVKLAPFQHLSAPKEVGTNNENFFNVMKQLAFASDELAPIKVLGVTGYFVLTGTNDQLNAQLSNLQEKNVLVQQCMELKPGVVDNAEQQLEALIKNREQILKQMAEIHSTVEPRRQKRLKKQRKFPKL